jgi:hypothetical protein
MVAHQLHLSRFTVTWGDIIGRYWQFTAASCIVAQGISLQDHLYVCPFSTICNHVRAVYAESHAGEQQGNCLGVERRPPLVNLEQND